MPRSEWLPENPYSKLTWEFSETWDKASRATAAHIAKKLREQGTALQADYKMVRGRAYLDLAAELEKAASPANKKCDSIDYFGVWH